jgi:hypothetical protein
MGGCHVPKVKWLKVKQWGIELEFGKGEKDRETERLTV